MRDSYNLIPKEELKNIKDNCAMQANNCGGCETCERMFSDPPPYDYQETYYLVVMIEERDKKIAELEEQLKTLRPD
jgi:hypothetical protein